jgi:hypothetical protein
MTRHVLSIVCNAAVIGLHNRKTLLSRHRTAGIGGIST